MAELNKLSLLNDANLVAYWRMEGNSNDSKGANNGTDTAITYSTDNGKFTQGAGFNGSTSKILSANKILNLSPTSAFTVGCWFKPNNTANSSALFYFSSNANGRSIDLEMPTSTTVRALLYGGNVGLYTTDAATVAATGEWHQATIVKNASDVVSLYIDGVFVDDVTASENAGSVVANGISFGRHPNVDVNYYTGTIDDAFAFSRALTAAEIMSLYRAQSSAWFMFM